MTAQIINLKRIRKSKARAARAADAAVNRAAHGRTKAEREGEAAEATREQRVLDGLKLTGPAANEGSFPSSAEHSGDDDLDPGNVS